MMSYICRILGYDIPDGPIVFVNNSENLLPCSIYDIEPSCVGGQEWDRNLEKRVFIDEQQKMEEDKIKNYNKEELFLFSKNV